MGITSSLCESRDEFPKEWISSRGRAMLPCVREEKKHTSIKANVVVIDCR
jgi:hypothetical protein